jgi:dolichol-phosphate mannosyltransferase
MGQNPSVSGTHPRIDSVDIYNQQLAPASVIVVVPTYNERENIASVLKALELQGLGVDVMVVDDGSPDGTADLAAQESANVAKRVTVMRRRGKFGLGSAYLDAHRWIVEHASHYRFVVQMDADFSHDPLMIPLLVREAEAYGLSVGSRYVEGGATPDWSHSRLLLSHSANFYLRMVLRAFFPSYPVRDNTSGFICWRMDVLAKVLQYPVLGDGYSFLTSLKAVAYHVGFPAKELPIVLRDRRLGVSKLNKNILFEAVKMPWRLGYMYRIKKGALLKEEATTHDNSPEMWDRYYASEDETGWFAGFVHWAREKYFGDLFARRVIQLGGKSESYLELGVGSAQTLSRLQKRTGARCVGIEKTPRAYELGKAYATNCEIVLGDGMNLPFADQTFDVAYSLGLLEHFESDEQAILLLEQARVTKNKVLVEVPARMPHMQMILWFNRRILGKRGVWADEELFSKKYFAQKYPGLPFEYFFDVASIGITCWFAISSADILKHIRRPS